MKVFLILFVTPVIWCLLGFTIGRFAFRGGRAQRDPRSGSTSVSGSASAAVATAPLASNPDAGPQPAQPNDKGGNETLDLSRAVQLPVSEPEAVFDLSIHFGPLGISRLCKIKISEAIDILKAMPEQLKEMQQRRTAWEQKQASGDTPQRVSSGGS